MKRNIIKLVSIFLVIVTLMLAVGCDTTEKKHPYIIINVNLSSTLPVSNAKKLFLVLYYSPNWVIPWMVLESPGKVFFIPRLNIGTTPLYLEVIYDFTGDGIINSGDYFQGWYNKSNVAGPPAPLTQGNLTPIILPNTEMVMLTIDLDNYDIIP